MAAEFEKFKTVRTFGSLDGLRAISIVMVIWHHSASTFFPSFRALRLGHLGVHFFFVISGFLITTLLLREREKHGDISLKHFYIRRSLRIFPLYYAVILLYVAVVGLVESNSTYGLAFWDNLKFYLTYTSNWFVPLDQPRVIFYFAWSLATEEQFYLMWPSIEKFLKGYWPVVVAFGLIVLNMATSAGWLSFLFAEGSVVHSILKSIAVPICLGVILAHVLNNRIGFRSAAIVLGHRWSSFAALVLLGITMTIPIALGLFAYTLIYLGMTLVVAACVIREDHWLAPSLSWAPMRLMGVLSYGMYLLHMLSYNAVKLMLKSLGFPHPLLLFIFTTIVAVGAAWISYHYIESYFLNLKQRFSRVG